jgi:peptidoglycan hydrolase-like protein with peptidoglycan-binding domain
MPAIRPAAVRARHRAVVTLLATSLVAVGLLAAPTGALAADALKQGSRGPVVAELQQKLSISADGVFGPQTARAVRRYQRHEGLTVDGVVGPQTADSLGLSLARAGTADHASHAVKLPPVLDTIAACESGGNPRAVSPDGSYRGKYQFTRSTWHAMGGSGDPARASEREQDRRALSLLRARGTAPWPSCG